MGEMKRAYAYREEPKIKDSFASTLGVAASIIAAVRLARNQNITRSSPRLAHPSVTIRASLHDTADTMAAILARQYLQPGLGLARRGRR
jgi:hypothetical protein